MLRFFIACALLLAGSFSYANCYSVYDGGGVLLLRTVQAPVDLQHRIGDVVRAKFGDGASMVFSAEDPECDPVTQGGTGSHSSWVGLGSVGAIGTMNVYSSAGSSYGGGYSGAGGSYGRRYSGAASYTHVGPRGGRYRYTASGNRSYQKRGR